MGDKYRAPGGWDVEIITLSATPDRHDGTWLRIRRWGFHIADVRTTAELERWIPLDGLEPEALAQAAPADTTSPSRKCQQVSGPDRAHVLVGR